MTVSAGQVPLRSIAVMNGKGGVLKTAVVANTAGLLAASGYSVLAVDMDPQGNLGEDLGYYGTEGDDQGRALAQALTFGGSAQVLEEVRRNLDVLPGGSYLDQASIMLRTAAQKDEARALQSLRRVLAELPKQYDMILIDCPPIEENLQTLAMIAARWVLVPARTDSASRHGLGGVAARLGRTLSLNPTIDLLGVVLTDTGVQAKNVVKKAKTAIDEELGREGLVFQQTVRHTEATAQESRDRGLLVHELDQLGKDSPKWYEVLKGIAEPGISIPAAATTLADDYAALTQEIVERIVAQGE